MRPNKHKLLAAACWLAACIVVEPHLNLYASTILQSAYTTVQDEGVDLVRRAVINFAGAGVTCADSGGKTVCTIPGGGGGGTNYQTVQDEGSDLPQQPTLNFAGAGVTCADGTLKTTCTIPGGGGAQTYQPFGITVPFALPDNSLYSWVNQSGATVTSPTTPGSIILQAASGVTDQVIMRARAYPTPPFTLTMQFTPINVGTGNFSLGGMCVADTGGTPKIIALWWGNVNGLQVRVQRWNNPTSNNGTSTNLGDIGLMPKWFQITDDNTNLIFKYSYDGTNFITADTQARTAFLTSPAQIGFCVNNLGTASKFYLTSEI